MISFSKMTAHAWPLASLLLLGSIGGLSADEQATDRVDSALNDPLPPRTLKLEPLSPETKNRIGLSYRIGLNMTVDFRKFGGLALSDPGPRSGTTVNRNYDNGYNRVDSSTNAGGQTWYWGYQNSRSVQGDNLVLQSYSTLNNANSNNRQEDPQHGFEFNYLRELYHKEHWRLSAEAALGYSHISIIDTRALRNTVYRTNDTFALNGVIPPNAPYYGTYEGPGPLISSNPSDRTTDVLVRSATITGDRNLDANVFTLRLGPYLEIPLNDRFTAF